MSMSDTSKTLAAFALKFEGIERWLFAAAFELRADDVTSFSLGRTTLCMSQESEKASQRAAGCVLAALSEVVLGEATKRSVCYLADAILETAACNDEFAEATSRNERISCLQAGVLELVSDFEPS